ncbi:hypothetical protein [Anatilimnocola floriformis]|uniref:hypothetical protein n=1 Tax=Anatilimnocola floriformis TaxID=2948575 RepID=UPI0020C3EE36|nr:hypothetical protein [Anatilimnocola floriformis]
MRSNFVSYFFTACLAISAATAFAEPPSREDLRALSPEEKAALLQKKERFDALAKEEQDRLRALNTSITSSEHGDQLHRTLDRYHEWLKSLTTKQRADLLGLPAEQRVERIKELMQEQERARLRDLGGKQLPEDDIDAIFGWLDEYMKQHEDKYLERLPDDVRKRILDQEEVSRRRSLMRGIIMRGPRNDFPMPLREDFERLLPKLSGATRAALDSAKTPEEKQQLARQWIFSAMISKVLPAASEEDLKKVFSELPPDQRERLERKSPEELKRELTWRFHWKQWPGREGGWRGGPGGGGPGGRGPGGKGEGPGPGPGEREPGNGPGGRGPGGRGPGGDRPKRPEGERSDAPTPPPPPPPKGEPKEVRPE